MVLVLALFLTWNLGSNYVARSYTSASNPEMGKFFHEALAKYNPAGRGSGGFGLWYEGMTDANNGVSGTGHLTQQILECDVLVFNPMDTVADGQALVPAGTVGFFHVGEPGIAAAELYRSDLLKLTIAATTTDLEIAEAWVGAGTARVAVVCENEDDTNYTYKRGEWQ